MEESKSRRADGGPVEPVVDETTESPVLTAFLGALLVMSINLHPGSRRQLMLPRMAKGMYRTSLQAIPLVDLRVILE